ncbi:MAG TPA: ribosome biogenesis GTPase Der [Planctomycetota bacterium]|nr:ribosome biogenesis GTPase Der [Planctomycetota bacterium]
MRVGGPPRVVVVGRPNVGKSTLFNVLAGRRVSIEDPMAGVTRDRVSFMLGIGDRELELVDTGGIGLVDETALAEEVDEQIAFALAVADHILFVIDAKEGVTGWDKQIAARLRKLKLPVIVVANKNEGRAAIAGIGEAHGLGFGEPVAVSARERMGTAALLDMLVERIGEAAVAPQVPSDVVALAIVGRVNVGKSTLVNALVGEPRVIVSDIPGTTRDAVDVGFSAEGRRFIAIDTAGLRKEKSVTDSVEFYSQSRTIRALRRADVVLLLIDATAEVGRIDKQLAGQVQELSVPAVIVVTKWDLARERAGTAEYESYIRKTLSGMPWAPIAFISALEGENLLPLLALAAQLHDQAGVRVTTGELNRVLKRAWEKRTPKVKGGRVGRIYYGSQVATHPPTIVLFVNEVALFDDNWRRYLMHELQEQLPYAEIPVRVQFQARKADDRE